MKQLLRQDQGATNIEIEKTGIRDFKRILDKYGVDYAITKNHDDPPRYLVFFKARDADTLTVAFKDYSASWSRKKNAPVFWSACNSSRPWLQSWYLTG